MIDFTGYPLSLSYLANMLVDHAIAGVHPMLDGGVATAVPRVLVGRIRLRGCLRLFPRISGAIEV